MSTTNINVPPWLSNNNLQPTPFKNGKKIKHTINVISNKNSSEIIQSPRPPETPKKSSKQSSIPNSLTFQPYHFTNPALLQEINNILSTGFQKLNLDKNDVSKANGNKNELDTENDGLDKLQVYREAFARFIEDFNIYRPFLLSVKNEYDRVVNLYATQIHLILSLQSQLATKEQEFQFKMKDHEHNTADVLTEAEIQRKALEKMIVEKDKEFNALQSQVTHLKQITNKAERELAEARSSCVTLTSSLTRLEEERRQVQMRHDAGENEVLVLKVSLEKGNEEIERLRRIIQDLESSQRLLVGQHIVDKHIETAQNMQVEIKKMDAAHRALIQRYSTLKAALDEAIRRNEEEDFSRLPPFTDTKTTSRRSSTGTADSAIYTPGPATKRVQIATTAASTSSPPSKLSLSIPPGTPGHPAPLSLSQQPTPSGVGSATVNNNNSINLSNINADPVEQLKMMLSNGGSPRLVIEGLINEILSLRAQIMNGGGGSGGWALKNDGDIVEMKLPSPWTHFEGLGISAAIPKYLRFQGRVRNLMLSKSQAASIISGVWTLKTERDRERVLGGTPPLTLSEALDAYLCSKLETRNMVVETAYSLLAVLRGIGGSGAAGGTGWTEGRLFLMVLEGTLAEEVRHDQEQMLTSLLEDLQTEESHQQSVPIPLIMNPGGISSGFKLPHDVFLRILKRHVPSKAESCWMKLEKAVMADSQGNSTINYRTNHNSGSPVFQLEQAMPILVETLRTQHLTEYQTYTDHVMAMIDLILSNGSGNVDYTNVSLGRLRESICMADPDKSRADVTLLLARGIGASVESVLLREAAQLPVNIDSFKMNLKRGMLKRSAATTHTVVVSPDKKIRSPRSFHDDI